MKVTDFTGDYDLVWIFFVCMCVHGSPSRPRLKGFEDAGVGVGVGAGVGVGVAKKQQGGVGVGVAII